MNGLETSLREAAERLTPAVAAPPAELWQQGRRRVRRRRVAGAGVLAVLVAVVALAGTWLPGLPSAHEAAPLGPGDGQRLPDRFFNPDAWLPGTESKGEIGPLVAVIGAERRSGPSTVKSGLVGVSGTTGEYRMLDLPFYDPSPDRGGNAVALSPDGRYVAYWRAGSEPLKSGSLGVYDTVEGDEVAWTPPDDEDHGFIGGDLVWAAGRIWFSYEVFREEPTNDGSSTVVRGPRAWEPFSGAVPVARTPLDSLSTGSADGADLVVAEGRRLTWFRAQGRATVRDSNLLLQEAVQVGPNGQVAGIVNPSAGDECCSEGPVAVGTIHGGKVTFREVTSEDFGEVLGWRDADHVVARKGRAPTDFVAVDVRDGSVEVLSRPASHNYVPGTIVAGEAWSAPTYDAPEPDWPTDPRLTIAVGVGGALAALVGLILWRRRVRA